PCPRCWPRLPGAFLLDDAAVAAQTMRRILLREEVTGRARAGPDGLARVFVCSPLVGRRPSLHQLQSQDGAGRLGAVERQTQQAALELGDAGFVKTGQLGESGQG